MPSNCRQKLVVRVQNELSIAIQSRDIFNQTDSQTDVISYKKFKFKVEETWTVSLKTNF